MSDLLSRLGLTELNSGAWAGAALDTSGGERVVSFNPTTGAAIASVSLATRAHYDTVVGRAAASFASWRMVPAPKRGEIVRQMGEVLRAHKADLGRLVTLEVGKLLSEGEGEVQESIDIADFAVGLSRQLYGLSMHSERPQHQIGRAHV